MKHSWTYKKLGEIADVTDYVANGSFASLRENVKYLDKPGYAILVRLADYTNNFDSSKYVYIDEHAYNFLSKSKLYGGEIIMSNVGSLGKEFICPNLGMPMSLAPNSIVIRTPNNKFFYYYFASQHFQDELKGISTTTALPKFNKTSFKNLSVPCTSLDEQQTIVRELDGINRLIDLQEEQLREYDRLAQSLFYTTFGDPITNPKGWEVKSLGEVGRVITGNTPSTRDANNYASSDVCFFKPSDFDADQLSQLCESEFKISNYAYEQSRKLPKGAILTTCIGIVGKVGILKTDATCNQQINAIIPNELTESYYLGYAILLIKNLLSEKANAPVVPLLNKSQFSAVCIPVPPLDLQQSFAAQIEAIEQQKALIRRSLNDTRTLLAARMQYYFE